MSGSYAEVNGLKMYYEVHGTGKTLVLLHGAFGTVETWDGFLPELVKTHQVIVVELQGHGHTADVDRPLRFTQMADDVAALLERLQVREADILGYSMGGTVALALAIAHPHLAASVAVLGAGAGPSKDTFTPEAYAQMHSIVPEEFNYPQVKDPYTRVAPDPSKWTELVSKALDLDAEFSGFDAAALASISARTLLMVGDRDGLRVEHVVECYRLIPNAQLAVLPNADHFYHSMEATVLALLSTFWATPSSL